MSQLFQRIHIIGPVGSGKTTLANHLERILKLPNYCLDNIVWERHPNGDIRRNPEIRDLLLQDVISKESWIVEGAQHKWVEGSFKRAEQIFLLDLPFETREEQIDRRYEHQLLGIEEASYIPSPDLLKQMHQWNRDYETHEKSSIQAMLQPYSQKVKIIESNRDIQELKEFLSD